MSTPFIVIEIQYYAVRTRIAALDERLCALADLLSLAGANRALIKIADEDLHDFARLDEAICDITWTRKHLLDACVRVYCSEGYLIRPHQGHSIPITHTYRPRRHHTEGSFTFRLGRVRRRCLRCSLSGSKSAGYGFWITTGGSSI